MSRVVAEGGARRIVPGSQVHYGVEPVRVPIAGETRADTPHLRVVKEQEQITAIEITCSCGCQLRLICDYDES